MESDIQPSNSPEQANAAPVMDVRPPAEQPEPEVDHQEKLEPPTLPKQKPPLVHKPPRQSNGVGLAVAATVIIVLGLAVLATYAYLQTQ